MKFDTETAGILDSEMACKKILEGKEFRSSEVFLKNVPEELLIKTWSGSTTSNTLIPFEPAE